MEYVKATTTLLITGAISYFTYEKVKESQEKKRSALICERIYQEILIDAFPIVKLQYQKQKNLKEEGKNEKDVEKIKAKLHQRIMVDLVAELCQKHQVTAERFNEWLNEVGNTHGQQLRDSVNTSVEELAQLREPKAFEYDIKDQLKKKEIATLTFRKYCDHQKFQVYHALRNALLNDLIHSEQDRQNVLKSLINPEHNWTVVFEGLGIPISEEAHESAGLEFRKAYYKLKFDRAWNSEIQRIENEHYTIMGAILAFTRGTSLESSIPKNPLDLPNKPTEYNFEINLPFIKDSSEELLLMLCQSYRAKFGRPTNSIEIKHQRLLDQIQQVVNSNTYKNVSSGANTGTNAATLSVASGSNTNKNLRNIVGSAIARKFKNPGDQDVNQSFTSSNRRRRGAGNNNVNDSQMLDQSINQSQTDINLDSSRIEQEPDHQQ